MKLIQIWNAQFAWKNLGQLKKPPKLAYRLMKYGRKWDREQEDINAVRLQILWKSAGAPEGSQVELNAGQPEFDAFMVAFNAAMEMESDIGPVGIDMDALVEGLDSQAGNQISESDLALLEPFFSVRADLKLVESPAA